MKEAYKKYGIGILIISLTILSLLYMMSHKNKPHEFRIASIEEEGDDLDLASKESIPIEEPIKVPVYVCGAVKKPEFYYLDQRAIVKEAIILAGGFTDDADTQAWNLAMEIQSGLKIDVPKIGEQIDKTDFSYDNRVGGMIPSHTATRRININRANSQELSTLPGIGPSISQNIIDYREANGEFKTLQDVTNVPRIGQATLEKIKDTICFQ